jgi:hypothetical protein
MLTDSQATKTASRIISPSIWPFVDHRKFARSPLCERALHALVSHINKHKDTSGARNFLDAFADTEFFEALCVFISENTCAKVVARSGKVVFLLEPDAPVLYKSFMDFHRVSKCRNREALFGIQGKPPKPAKPEYVDLMDTRLRYPGSYGSSSRR